MERISLSMPAIRIKLTGICNRSCSFCHEEGDMKRIQNVLPTENFFDCVKQIMERTDIKRVMLTGGEPTLNTELNEIVLGLKKFSSDISITTNGVKKVSLEEWQQLKDNGLTKVIVSMHNTSPGDLLKIEFIKKTLAWAENALKNQYQNVENVVTASIPSRINIVACDSFEKTYDSVEKLLNLQKDGSPEIRLLNNLNEPFDSQWIIQKIITKLGAYKINKHQKAGSSNVTSTYITLQGKVISVKLAFPYYLESICDTCLIKDKCYEGFYGIRLERLMDEYYVRLCIYKQTKDVLIPWTDFVEGSTIKEIRKCNVFI